MGKLLWGTPKDLRTLLCELVSWESRTLTEGEKEFPFKVENKLKQLDYFKQHPEFLALHEADQGRNLVMALYEHPKAADTIVLISHFDTVQTEEYGDLEQLAFRPEELTKKLFERKDDLPEEARADLESGNYLFGRGTMDMKMGLALHMALIEKASMENWPLNLVLLTVPDEEVNSMGMRKAVSELVNLREERGLSYKMFFNSEPAFSQKPGDEKHYVYSGTLGKIMPAALFYGKETHVGEPLKGMTANYMASFLSQAMEWNALYRESDLGESTPLPVSLQQKDLKMQYSTQTPYRATALYNVFLMKRNAAEVMELFEQTAMQAATMCNTAYSGLCRREGIEGIGEVQVLRFEQLLEYAEAKRGVRFVSKLKAEILAHPEWDEREKSLRIADKLMIQCHELAPAIILLFAPPYYPAVNSSEDPFIMECIATVKRAAAENGVEVDQVHYFNGLCDLSYVNYSDPGNGWSSYERNTPVWGETYSIPFADMLELRAPVLNVGPFGKDAHQYTERLHMDSAFVHTPHMLESLMKSLCKKVLETV
ncbi:M20/M25/M40 family metallo-hydrolase [Planococcus faecalis]|uniref:Amino acid degradation protein n=1 Tax=Planococcus faecalis TaxID=1598147 RepID=A0ABN4XTX4_9BACL|nr:M20/M25/M40 family metallo-hydrolase [Planococcus faecalis]AQU80674.1 amino acid degradation protein [Planococcus faecalis]OHX55671.1 amino acid degradation protein [Planococcus faecalis]